VAAGCSSFLLMFCKPKADIDKMNIFVEFSLK